MRERNDGKGRLINRRMNAVAAPGRGCTGGTELKEGTGDSGVRLGSYVRGSTESESTYRTDSGRDVFKWESGNRRPGAGKQREHDTWPMRLA